MIDIIGCDPELDEDGNEIEVRNMEEEGTTLMHDPNPEKVRDMEEEGTPDGNQSSVNLAYRILDDLTKEKREDILNRVLNANN